MSTSAGLVFDLFTGQGAAAAGYVRAGFAVVGVDSDRTATRRNPFPTVTDDWLHGLHVLLDLYGRPSFVHASPPCQRYSHGTVAGHAHKHPDLIGAVREELVRLGLPYVLENVPRSPLRPDVVLCGSQFGLATADDDGVMLHLRRHRVFESTFALSPPVACSHPKGIQWAGVYGGARRDKHEARHVRRGGYVPGWSQQQRLMGVDWMTQRGLKEAIPPAYTEWIGSLVSRSLAVAA